MGKSGPGLASDYCDTTGDDGPDSADEGHDGVGHGNQGTLMEAVTGCMMAVRCQTLARVLIIGDVTGKTKMDLVL